MSDDGSLLAELGVVIDRDYVMSVPVWEIALEIAMASTERSSCDR